MVYIRQGRATVSAIAVTAVEIYGAYVNKAWELSSTADVVFAVSSTASIAGLILCILLRLWKRRVRQPIIDEVATPVTLLAEGVYAGDDDMMRAASTLLPVQSGIIVILWICAASVASVGVSAWAPALCTLVYFALALCLRWVRKRSTLDRYQEGLRTFCLLPLSLEVMEVVFLCSKGVSFEAGAMLFADRFAAANLLLWVSGFVWQLIIEPPQFALFVIARDGTWTWFGHTIDKRHAVDLLAYYCLVYMVFMFSVGYDRDKITVWAPALVLVLLAGLVYVVKPRQTLAGAVQDMIPFTVEVNKIIHFLSVSIGAIGLVIFGHALEHGDAVVVWAIFGAVLVVLFLTGLADAVEFGGAPGGAVLAGGLGGGRYTLDKDKVIDVLFDRCCAIALVFCIVGFNRSGLVPPDQLFACQYGYLAAPTVFIAKNTKGIFTIKFPTTLSIRRCFPC